MNSIQRITMVSVQMSRILKSAVVLSWGDLLRPSQPGLIQIEYASGNRLRYLKIWHLTGSGEWRLVCEYRMPPRSNDRPGDGMTFSNDYHSAGLAEMLGVIMRHQDNFAPSFPPGSGLIQITLPTEDENFTSRACMRHVYESFGLRFTHIPAAAEA